MAIAWFLAPYDRILAERFPARECRMNVYTALIAADGGAWAETEVLGNHAVVKVRASAETLATIAADPDITRLPVALLDDPLSSLSPAQKTAIRNKVQALGYTLAEINARFPGDLGDYTLRDVLRFVATRRRKPRYEAGTDSIVLDGVAVTPESVESVDGRVQ